MMFVINAVSHQRYLKFSFFDKMIYNNIIIITSLFREDDILSNANYLSGIQSSMIKIMYLNYRQFVQYIHIQYENVTFKSLCLGSTFTCEITKSI